MSILRTIVLPAWIAGMILACPYTVSLGVSLTLVSLVDTPFRATDSFSATLSFAVVFGATSTAILGLIPAIFFGIARISWREEHMVVREYLFGWPVAIAVVTGIALGFWLGRGGAMWLAVSVVLSLLMAASGVLSAFLWRRLAYRR